MQAEWIVFKDFVSNRSLSIQWIDLGTVYWLKAFDAQFDLECTLNKESQVDEIEDFESNFKANGNKRLSEPRDSDGSPLQRVKITTTGWHYQLHGIEFETSKLGSQYSKKVDGTDYGFTTMKFYKSVEGVETLITGVDLNQDFLDANCVKTIIDWEPNHDIEIVGGMLKLKEIPSEDLRLWVIGVPDVPAEMGGSKPFAVNVNLAFVGVEEGVKVDGRAPKYLTYHPVYHSTKLRIMLRHSVGFKHKMSMVFELFKA